MNAVKSTNLLDLALSAAIFAGDVEKCQQIKRAAKTIRLTSSGQLALDAYELEQRASYFSSLTIRSAP